MVAKMTDNAVHKNEMDLDLEEALDLAGAGKYQVFHCLLMWSTLAAALLEMIGYAFILPAAACDLELPEELRGLITSIPCIGVILTAPFWGHIADKYGRKPTLQVTCIASGFFCLVAAIMPNLLSFAITKFLGSLFLSAPSSLGFAYAGEMVPRKRRDLAVLVCNGLLTLSSVLSPLLAWACLTNDWEYPLGPLDLRPWRLLTVVYATPLLMTAAWMTQAKESPKFLVAKGRKLEALEVLKHIFVKNTDQSSLNYKVNSIKSDEDSLKAIHEGSVLELRQTTGVPTCALLRPPHLKWFALTAFLMFGLYTLLNGLFLFAANMINQALQDTSGEEGTLCLFINQPENLTTTDCTSGISQSTFVVMSGSTFVYAIIVAAASITPLSKKTLLCSMYVTTGVATLLSGLLTNRIVAGFAMSAMQLTALGIGPLTAYTVQLFPTCLRGTAIGAVLMFGRVGAVFGAMVSGYLLAAACTATFYGFAALVFLCAGLTFLLPGNKTKETCNNNNNEDNGLSK